MWTANAKWEYRQLVDAFRDQVRKKLPISTRPYDTPSPIHPAEAEQVGRLLIQLGEMERLYAGLPDPPPEPEPGPEGI